MSLDAQYFADLYADSDDPWAFRTRWYERRKRDLALASLPRNAMSAYSSQPAPTAS
jgi:hypothetical protein